MKAGVFYGKEDIRVEEVKDLQAEKGTVIVKVKAAGICGSDLHFYRGVVDLPKGTVLCHELSGEIVEVGEGVSSFKVGDRVGIEPLIGCGECRFCKVGEYHLCAQLKHIGIFYSGGFAEFSRVPEDKLYKLPENVSFEVASLLDCYAVSVHAINKVRVEVDDVVVILGGGPLGLTTAQVVKAAGVNEVVLVDLIDGVLEVAKKAGIGCTINATKEDVVKKVKELSGGLGADVVFEAVGGDAPTLNQAIQLARPGGTVGIIGARMEASNLDVWTAFIKELNIQFVWSYAMWGFKREFDIALNLLASGKINAAPLITHKVSLDEINKGFRLANNKKESNAVKVLVIP
jgi:(R,R)-butanediol dehydrogenase/meso-butanediol dehydrogenase/diacetyl reductase